MSKLLSTLKSNEIVDSNKHRTVFFTLLASMKHCHWCGVIKLTPT